MFSTDAKNIQMARRRNCKLPDAAKAVVRFMLHCVDVKGKPY